MCDCEELDYDEFMVMLKAIKTPSAPLTVAQTGSPVPVEEPIPLVIPIKQRK
jgi:hypothetical protein